MKKLISIVGGGLFLMACGPGPLPEYGQVNLAVQGDNGVSLNGTTFGGLAMSSAYQTSYNSFGEPFQFPSGRFNPINAFDPVAGVGPNGPTLDGLQLSTLGSIVIDGDVDIGDVMGAELEGELIDGGDVLLKIGGVAQGTAPNDDLLYYQVYVADGVNWSPLCGYGADGAPIAAIGVPGVWNHEQGTNKGGEWKKDHQDFSFACRGSSVAKCVEIGYKPWTDPDSEGGTISRREAKKLEDPNHLQACVRMLRADYCGDGTPWTVNGRQVEFWDSMEMHTEEMNWTFEAAWSPDGAECLSVTRVESALLTSDLKDDLPKCVAKKVRKLENKADCLDDDFDKLYKDDKFLFSSFESRLLGSGGNNNNN